MEHHSGDSKHSSGKGIWLCLLFPEEFCLAPTAAAAASRKVGTLPSASVSQFAFGLIQSRCPFVFASSCGFPPNKSLQGVQVTSGFRRPFIPTVPTLCSLGRVGGSHCAFGVGPRLDTALTLAPGSLVVRSWFTQAERHGEKAWRGISSQKCPKPGGRGLGTPVTLICSTMLQHRRMAPSSSP